MKRGLVQRWRERGGRRVRIALPFDDLMAFALALLSVPPAELAMLDLRFADRKRLLDRFLRAGKVAQGLPYDTVGQTMITVDLPQRDVDRLERFARKSLPKAAPDAGMLDRVSKVLGAASHRRAVATINSAITHNPDSQIRGDRAPVSSRANPEGLPQMDPCELDRENCQQAFPENS